MQRHLDLINKQWKGLYVTTESGVEHADGIYDHMEWFIPENIYSDPNVIPKLKCFLIPKYEEDKELYGVDENGFIVRIYDVDTFKIMLLDEFGNIKK